MPKSVFTEAYGSLIEKLVARRKELGVSQVELAARLGKTQQFVSYVERCERRLDILEFYAIAQALGDEPKKLFGQVTAGLSDKVSI